MMLVAAALIEMNRAWVALIVDGPRAAERHLESARGTLAMAGARLGVGPDEHAALLDAWKLTDDLADAIRQAREIPGTVPAIQEGTNGTT